MPIYEYQCAACQKINEVMQKMSDPAPEACPSCGKGPLAKIMSQTGFVLKGSGWYVTDFRNGNKPAAKADTTAKEAAPASSEGAGTAKPADTKATAPTDAKS